MWPRPRKPEVLLPTIRRQTKLIAKSLNLYKQREQKLTSLYIVNLVCLAIANSNKRCDSSVALFIFQVLNSIYFLN